MHWPGEQSDLIYRCEQIVQGLAHGRMRINIISQNRVGNTCIHGKLEQVDYFIGFRAVQMRPQNQSCFPSITAFIIPAVAFRTRALGTAAICSRAILLHSRLCGLPLPSYPLWKAGDPEIHCREPRLCWRWCGYRHPISGIYDTAVIQGYIGKLQTSCHIAHRPDMRDGRPQAFICFTAPRCVSSIPALSG